MVIVIKDVSEQPSEPSTGAIPIPDRTHMQITVLIVGKNYRPVSRSTDETRSSRVPNHPLAFLIARVPRTSDLAHQLRIEARICCDG